MGTLQPLPIGQLLAHCGHIRLPALPCVLLRRGWQCTVHFLSCWYVQGKHLCGLWRPELLHKLSCRHLFEAQLDDMYRVPAEYIRE